MGADPRDPRIVQVLNELGANDSHRDTVARCLLPVQEPFIEQYVENTSSPLHSYKLKVVCCFKIDRPGDREFKNGLANHKLLWHGTMPENVYPILRDGYRSTLGSENGMYGRGIYFSDCVTKAANYCTNEVKKFMDGGDAGEHTPNFRPYGYLFLSEVALGRMNEYTQAENNAKALLNGADSTFARGSYRPDGEFILRGSEPPVVVPMGPLKKFERLYLRHNEYVIYVSTQVRHSYLVKVEMYK